METSSTRSDEPLVSIIIPTYKRSETLARAVDSCLRQTYAHIEVLVVDDNPQKSDARRATEDVMQRYAGDVRVRYLQRDQNGGGALARNTGIDSALGFYVTFLDDDDEYFENKIDEQVREMEQGYDMIFSDIEIVDLNSHTRQIHTYRRDFSLDYSGLLTKHLVDVISGTPTFMYTREALRRIGGFDDIPANQEYVLMLKTIAHRLKIGYLPKVLCRAYMGGPGLRISDGDQIIKAKIDVIRRIRPFLKDIARVDRRRTMYRLNAFVFYQSLKRRKATALVYGFRLLGYVDLLLQSRRRHSHKGDVLYK